MSKKMNFFFYAVKFLILFKSVILFDVTKGKKINKFYGIINGLNSYTITNTLFQGIK